MVPTMVRNIPCAGSSRNEELLMSIADITYNSGPMIIHRYLSEDEKQRFLRPGYRFRIVKLASPFIFHFGGLS